MIVYPAVGVVERRAAQILMNSEAERQVHLQPEAMMVWVDIDHPKRELEMKGSRAGLAADLLSDDRRSGRINAGNAYIEYTSPSGGVYEKRPNKIDRRIDDGRWTARIGHRTSSLVIDIWQSV
jgi:hypothetical protein